MVSKEHYWDKDSYIYFDRIFLERIGLGVATVDILSDLGLPEWAAPNMNFNFNYQDVKDRKVLIGTDRDDFEIWINIDNEIVYSGNGCYVNKDISLLRESLKLYAEMIEEALKHDENSFLANNIPNIFIYNFEGRLKILDVDALNNGSFWSNEINRLLKR